MAVPRSSLPQATGGKRVTVWRAAMLTGSGLALFAVAALYVVLGTPSAGDILARVRGEPSITRGFIGMAQFGQWRLICAPGPAPLNGLTPPAGVPAPVNAPAANACRINQEMPAPQEKEVAASQAAKVLIAANFSLVGERRSPVAMLRLPPTARPGDVIAVRFDDGTTVKTVVRDCAEAECFATGALTEGDWTRLTVARSLQVTFPVAGRQWVLLDLSVEGLPAAIAALARAENPPGA